MKFTKGFCIAALVVLAGCSSQMSAISMLDRAQPVGSPYTKYLANEYRILADSLNDGAFGGHIFNSQAEYIAKKGLAAVDGMIVEPETLNDNNAGMAEAAAMAEARGRLVTALDDGGRDNAPDLAAIAQAHFDCWALQQPNFPGEDVPCRGQFELAMDQLNKALAAAAPPAGMPASEGAASSSSEFPSPITGGSGNGPLQQASYQVFFDWDKSTISASAHGVIDTVSQQIGSHNDIRKIVIIGHTDTSGGEKYNMKLSLRRAEAVRKVLINEGIPAAKIRVEGRGKSDLLVKTPDGVREPQNRRVQITFE